ncbi:hypothetical protein RFI_06447 [Reticulomyxa filosa]|uniref:Uncharacterized protein n=1 Tax=Reticulomyxa filosa TaxID=46433 RepID=X6NXR4_RETFI|nr:hypothetical protein RFI_06447 [Reticulomyxa filosa]|eukprot:ETO30673.1 hypothetical protein RFI_06447 [Reticulomyxa filosa]
MSSENAPSASSIPKKEEIIAKLAQLPSIKQAEQYMLKTYGENCDPSQALFRTNNNDNNEESEHNAEYSSQHEEEIQECMYEHCQNKEKQKENKEFNLYCRNCHIVLCQDCCKSLKVLQCAYCNNDFICSRLCYTQLSNKDKNNKLKHLMPHLQFQSLQYQFQVLEDHNFSEEDYIHQLCFKTCSGCAIQNCGCKPWTCCRDCHKFYCSECSIRLLQKCQLEECECFTCCCKQNWNRNCFYCNVKQSQNNHEICGLLFCTRGHCTSHIISSMPSIVSIDTNQTEQKQ